FTRPGLAPVYSFANILIISQLIILGSSSLGTFTYTGTTPTTNEGFLLSGFTGFATFLNGQTVYVIAVGLTTFTAIVMGTPGTYLGLSGTATSTTGSFVGPNPPTVAQDIDTASTPWVNIDNILGDIGYASVNLGAGTAVTLVPSGASNQSSTLAWTSPNNLVATGASYATVALSAGQVSAVLLATGLPFVLPADAIVQGLSVAVSAASSSSTNGAQGPKGCTAVSGGAWTNPTYIEVQDGNSATKTIVGQNSSFNFSTSGFISASGFGFSIPIGATVTGITAAIVRANLTGGATYLVDSSIQLLKAGVATGTNMATGTYWPAALQTAQYGGSSNLWGATWAPADINNAGFGIWVNVQNSSSGYYIFEHGQEVWVNGPTATAGIDFISLTVNYTQGNTSGSVTVQLFNAGTALSGAGAAIGQPVTSTVLPYVLGNNSYLWGQSASNLLSIINGGGLGVSLVAALSGTGTSTFEANSLSVTAYYTSPDSDALQARTFNFA
ncbi:MAG: hypothetical protein ABSD89_15420, partial [Halobacteriota archaeon]